MYIGRKVYVYFFLKPLSKMNNSLNITEYLTEFSTFECPVCVLPVDIIQVKYMFGLLVVCCVALWYFYIFLLEDLLKNSKMTIIKQVIIHKTFMAILFLLLALTLNFYFYI